MPVEIKNGIGVRAIFKYFSLMVLFAVSGCVCHEGELIAAI